MKLASEAPFPYGYPGRVCYMELREGALTQLATRDSVRAAVHRATQDEATTIYAAWPGQHRTDLFMVDDLAALSEAVKAGAA